MRRLVLLLVIACGCASKSDGPAPVLSSVQPDPICDAQKMITLTLSGSGFSPAVDRGLTSSPIVLMPDVTLDDGAGTTIDIPPEDISLPDTTGTMLTVTVPQSLIPPGTYNVTVTNPDGHSSTITGGLTVDPPPDLVTVSPNAGNIGQTVTVTLTGTGFRQTMTVTLDATPPVTGTVVSVSADGTTATVTFDLTNVAAGTYSITVDNLDGCTSTLANAFTVRSLEFSIMGIDPPFGCMCDTTTPVTITSAGGFVSTPTAYMVPHGQTSPRFDLKRVAYVDANTITAEVPTGMMALSPPMYDLYVVNPPSDGRIGTLLNAFTVVQMHVPVIDDVVPGRGAPGATNFTIDIYGQYFRAPIKVELLDSTLTVQATATGAQTTVPASDHATATFSALPSTEGAYLVRLTDLDENTYSTYSAFIVGVEGPSGNLHRFSQSTMLVTGRRMLGGVSARDDLNNSFVYALGGDTGGATPTVLASVEVAQLSKFGALSAWHQEKATGAMIAGNAMQHPRDAVVAAAVDIPQAGDPCTSIDIVCLPPAKTYVYAIAGRDDAGTVRSDIERAIVLHNNNAPVMGDPVATTTGTLATGTWYYKVSAICSASATDPDNPNGESLPSDEAIITLDSTHNAVTLAWSAAPATDQCHPVGYKVYRTKAANGTSQQELLTTTLGNVLTYTDNGDTAGMEVPLPPGSLGVWVTAGVSLNAARWGHQAAVIYDNQGGTGGRSLYVLGGKSDNAGGYLATVERSSIDAATGNLGSFSTSATTGSGLTSMPTAIAFFSLTIETPQNTKGYTGTARLITLGGVDIGGMAAMGAASGEVELSDIASGGGNGTWTAPAFANNTILAAGGVMAVIASNKVFALGGSAMATNTTFSNVRGGGEDIAFDATGTVISPINSTAESFSNATPNGSPLALGVPITGSGFIYFVGGSSDGTNAVNTVYQTF